MRMRQGGIAVEVTPEQWLLIRGLSPAGVAK